MWTNERPSRENIAPRQPSEPLPWLSDNILIAAVAAAFLLLHILVGVIFLTGTTQAPSSEQETASSWYD
jgi:hypothetical protein